MPPSYTRPEPAEYASYYASYIGKVPDGDLLGTLESQGKEFARLLGSVPESRGDFAYAPGKWTLKEVVSHLTDAERVFSYRALRIARADATPLPGFDENAWVPNSGARQRTLRDLVGEFQAVRGATVALFRHLPAEALPRVGTANNHPVSVRALAWIVAGHALHHEGLIRERYLG
ncbi:MAG: DinB family protein [Gemmatimonadales bacterium]